MLIKKIKCADDNIFNSRLVVQIIEEVVGCKIEIIRGVTGAVGSARGAMEGWTKMNRQTPDQKYKKAL